VREPRQHYDGPVEIWVDGLKRLEARVRLTGYVDVAEIRTMGGVSHMDGVTSWDGYLVLPQHNLFDLVGLQLDLNLSNGQTGRAVLKDTSSGFVLGTRETPFD